MNPRAGERQVRKTICPRLSGHRERAAEWAGAGQSVELESGHDRRPAAT